MSSWLRKLIRGALAVAVLGVVVVALALGGFRLLVTRLPSYQADVQAWVNDELGVQLSFARLDARWSWRGPEITFHEASVTAADDTAPFLTAQTASVGLSPGGLITRLLARRALGIDRLTFERTELTLVKNEDGAYRLQGAPARELSVDVPPDVEVLVRDSRVLYLDRNRGLEWDFQDVAGSMRRDGDALLLEASARPPSEFANRIELTAQGIIGPRDAPAAPGATQREGPAFTGDWRLSAKIEGVDLAVAARLLPASAVVALAGQGDVAVQFELQRGVLRSGATDLELVDVVLQSARGTAGSSYERIRLAGDWQRDGEDWRIALKDVAVTRAGRSWPMSSTADIELARDTVGLARLTLRSEFLRLEDLTPFFVPLPESRLLESWFALAPRGDLRDVNLALARTAAGVDYTVDGQFAGFGIDSVGELPGIGALTGELHADSRSGRIELRSTDTVLDWPSVFRGPLDFVELRGILVWREGQDAVRLVSDDLVVATSDVSTRSDLELTLPIDGSSPRLELQTAISAFDVAAALRYLPAYKMSETVVDWLDRALRGGRVSNADVSFVGPVRAFPFDGGEGEFRATADFSEGALAFIADWPLAEELNGTIEFVNAGFAARGSGRVLGNRTADVRAGIGDLRAGLLTLQAATIGPLGQVLAFLQGAPPIARYLGKDFSRLESPSGIGEVSVDLLLPLRDLETYRLNAALDVIDGELAFRGFEPHATEIQGALALTEGAVRGEGIQAIFLDGPVTARVDAAGVAGYRTRIDLEGEVTIDAVTDAFNLPYAELLAGQTRWQGSMLIPTAGAQEGQAVPRITVTSNLSGVALRFPAPFEKAPAEPSGLQVDMTFPDGGFEMHGNLGATRRFALEFDADPNTEGKFEFRRAALRFGGALPEFRFDRGVTVDGSLPQLRVDDWLSLPQASSGQPSQWSGVFSGADLNVADFSVFGQELGSASISARRRTDDWQIELDSNAIAGTLLVPIDLAREPKVVAVMRRLYLNVGNDVPARRVDPRELPGLQLHSDEFGVGQRQLGRLDAEILSDPLGLRLVSFESATDSFSAQGSGGWFTGVDGDTTRFALSMNSSNVAKALEELGFDPIFEAKTAAVTASVYWPGPPSGAWMNHVSGDFALHAENGSLIDVQPGAGRVVGLLSISALPRRLALDFRDVFNRGLVFDEITADFVIVDGNAYTDNLKLTGPAAEVGVIGRTGLRDRDYRQQAVVTAEPGKVLPTVGALLGGPGVAAALLIFTRIFKKPLRGIGRASYCVTGSWQEPTVERLSAEQLEQGELCAELPPNGALGKPAEAAR